MPNRIEQISKEAHRVNRERYARGLRHPEIHDSPEQEALNELISGLGTEIEKGVVNHHVVQYALTVRDH